MRKIRLYWNNICVLHKGELVFLDGIKRELEEEGIELEVTCFGLGYKYHLSDYLRREDSILPDLIVSADLEVFEDERIFNRFKANLYPAFSWFKTKEGESVPSVYRNNFLLPYVIIPLVFYSPLKDVNKNLSLKEVASSSLPIAFGGINNSAGKSVVKTLLSSYKEEITSSIFKNALVTNMPVEAFNCARRGIKPLALVPSLFALNDSEGVAFAPLDGAVAVPSYIAALKTADESDLKSVVEKLNSPALLSFYRDRGALVTALASSLENEWFVKENRGFQLPSNEYLKSLDSAAFYRYYCKHIPSADKHY